MERFQIYCQFEKDKYYYTSHKCIEILEVDKSELFYSEGGTLCLKLSEHNKNLYLIGCKDKYIKLRLALKDDIGISEKYLFETYEEALKIKRQIEIQGVIL